MTDERQLPSPLGAEEAIIDARRAKARTVRARGDNPFATASNSARAPGEGAPRLGGRTVDIAEARAIA
jgi:hypothetical protein